ncbi:MAG: sugar transferase [Candidatus Zipacnadales bacterium]
MNTQGRRLLRVVGLFIKTILEWCLALLALIMLLPLLFLIALLIKLTSPGPVFYLAERLGRGGRPFRMFKFRSMQADAVEHLTNDDRVIVEPGDKRLTPIGKWLRIGFDELPQLANVLKGDMALIGPRPDTVWMLPKYSAEVLPRLNMRPGITGLAQVLGGRDLSPRLNYLLDCHYITHWSPWLDLRIALYTIPYVIGIKWVGHKWLRRIVPEPTRGGKPN